MFKGIYGVRKDVVVRKTVCAELKLRLIKAYLDGYDGIFKLIELNSGISDTVNDIESVMKLQWEGSWKIEIINIPVDYRDIRIIYYQSIEDFEKKFIE